MEQLPCQPLNPDKEAFSPPSDRFKPMEPTNFVTPTRTSVAPVTNFGTLALLVTVVDV
jgi:hypothetical protein